MGLDGKVRGEGVSVCGSSVCDVSTGYQTPTDVVDLTCRHHASSCSEHSMYCAVNNSPCLKHSPPHDTPSLFQAWPASRVCQLQGTSHKKRKCNGDSTARLNKRLLLDGYAFRFRRVTGSGVCGGKHLPDRHNSPQYYLSVLSDFESRCVRCPGLSTWLGEREVVLTSLAPDGILQEVA